MTVVDDFRLKLGTLEVVPIMIGGMGVDISTSEMALEACRLGGIGHISDAMSPFVSDKKYKSGLTQAKSKVYKDNRDNPDKTHVKFDLEQLRIGQLNHVGKTVDRKSGPGAIFVNIMEKLNMAAPAETLRTRLHAALDAGIDGITLSAGLHIHSLQLIEDNPRFRDAKIGIIVSSVRALRIFLRGAKRVNRLPDYITVEGPLAGGHLGFGNDWKKHSLKTIVAEVLAYLKKEHCSIPVIPAGGIFTGSDAVEYLASGAAAVQVATRFTVTEECGLPDGVKQKYFEASEEDLIVSDSSPTGYLIRMLKNSPCLISTIKPQCEPFGYILGKDGKCAYADAYWENRAAGIPVEKSVANGKICLCYHFSKYTCYTCGHNVYRLKDTSSKNPDGKYQLLSTEHVFQDYQYSNDYEIALPKAGPISRRLI